MLFEMLSAPLAPNIPKSLQVPKKHLPTNEVSKSRKCHDLNWQKRKSEGMRMSKNKSHTRKRTLEGHYKSAFMKVSECPKIGRSMHYI